MNLSNWEKWAERPSTVNRNELFAPHLWEDGGIDFLAIPRGKNVEYWMTREPKRRYYKKIALKLLDAGLEQHLDMYKTLAKKTIEKSIFNTAQNNAKLAEHYKEFFQAQRKFAFFYDSPWAVEEFLDPVLRQKLITQFGKQRGMELYAKLTLQTELIAFQEMQIELQKLANNYGEEDVEKLVKKWAWMAEYSLQEKLYDGEYFKKQLEILKHSEQGADIKEKIGQNSQVFQEALALLDEETAKLAKLINTYITLRTHRIDVLKQALANMRPFYEELAKRIGKRFTYNHVINLTIEETLNFLEHETIPKFEEVHKRTEGKVAYYCRGGKAEFIPVHLITKPEHKTSVAKTAGTTANTGIVTAQAVIVNSKSDLLKVRTGCVLVARTTYPEYTQLMRKAVAIVTDEGGITSHAAIVSRELGVPCVVGTKNATRIFSDNELITVDAERGIVEKA